jgi:hypothetical protein
MHHVLGAIREYDSKLTFGRPGFATESGFVGFVVVEDSLRQVFIRVLWLYPANIIPPRLSILIYHRG